MTEVLARAIPNGNAGAELTATKAPNEDIGAFLAVFAALMLDTILSFEETVGRITDMVMANGQAERELIVTLQSFDRLQQEFTALGDALSRYAQIANDGSSSSDERMQLGREVIAAITVADLKDRLMRRLRDETDELRTAPTGEEEEEVF
jgi:hypothetical protein